MPVQMSTSLYQKVAFAGMLADTSLLQVDGATAAESAIGIGRPVVVTRGDNSTKVVRGMTASDISSLAGKLIGITLHSHYAAVTGRYEAGDAVNVVRIGRVWAVSGLAAAPVAGTPVRIVVGGTPAVASVNTAGGTVVPGWSFTGAFETQADGSTIAEIELSIPQIAAATSGA